MTFWIILFTFLIALTLLYKDKIFLVWFFIWAVIAFRYKVGTDYMGYVNLFQGFQQGMMNPHYNFDFGMIGIFNFVDFLGGSYQLVFVIYAILTILFFYKGFKFYSQNIQLLDIVFLLLFLAFLFFSVVHIIRFELASAILLYASKYIIEKRPIKYLFYILLATLFHITAIIFLFVYPLGKLRVNYKTIIIFIATSTFIIFAHPIKNIITYLSNYNLPYLFYLTSEKYNITASTFAIINTYIYITIALLTYKYFTKNRIDQFVFIMFLVYIFTRVLSFDIYVFARLSLYFKPFLIIYLGYLILKINFTHKQISWMLFLLVLYGSLGGSLYGILKREGLQKIFYTQYSVNVGLFNSPYIISIYGDPSKLPDNNMEP